MEYITEILGLPVTREMWEQENKLPFFLTGKYEYEAVEIDGFPCVFVRPKEEMDAVNMVKKHIQRIRDISGAPVVLETAAITRYRRKALIEAKIPFVVPGKQIYLPFLGLLLTNKCDSTEPKPEEVQALQPSAQMLLFSFILGGNVPMALSPMAKRLGVSAMTITRAAQQLCATGFLQKSSAGVQKILKAKLTPEELFQKMRPYLIDPVRKTVYISKEKILPNMFSAGLSALSELSMLGPPSVPVWGTVRLRKDADAVTKQLLNSEKQCKLQVWKYDPRLISQTDQVDVLSLVCSFGENADERIEQSIDELLKGIW